MSAYIQDVIAFIAQHPHWAGILVFLTATVEAIAVIGAFVPGTTILVGIGTVVGLGHLPLWPILIWAVLGAIAGDGLSYWLGHRYRDHITGVWPFSRRPELIAQGEAFFHRHGAMSIVIGRFLPMTRAVVPVVAGTLGMKPLRFTLVNVLSALAWAPLHILPGVAFGGMLSVIGGISGRLVAVLLGVLLLGLAFAWVLRIAVLRIGPLIARLQVATFEWARERPGRLPQAVANALDPGEPGARTVLLLGAVGAVCGIGFVDILRDVVAGDSVIQADTAVSHLVQGLRTGWADDVMVGVTMMGDFTVTFAVALATVAWLGWRRQWQLAAGFAVTLILSEISVTVLKAALKQPRPIDIYSGAEAFSFPSGHATMAAVLYGMLAWLVSTSLPPRGRVAALAIAGGLVGVIAASRIYLAAHWPSDVGAGIALGFGLATVFALVYRRRVETHQRLAGLLPVVLVILLGVGGWHLWQGFDANLERYAHQVKVTVMPAAEWQATGWQALPRGRIDLGGETEESFVLQWAGPAATLAAALQQTKGWHPPVGWSLLAATAFATPAAGPADLPVLPLLHDGREPVLVLVEPTSDSDTRLILRAWPSGYAVDDSAGQRPILLVAVTRERIIHPWRLASLPVDRAVSGAAAESILAGFSANERSPQPGLLLAGP